MPEGVDSTIRTPAPQERQVPLKPIGDRIIGTVNPRNLSRQEFDSSPELLFHGALERFEFQRKIITGPYSSTVGSGFYTTDDRENAAFYSKIRKNFQGDPEIVAVLPYEARMLDMRAESNPGINAHVSTEYLKEYRDFIVAQIKAKFPGGPPDVNVDQQGTLYYENLSKYRSVLNNLFFQSEAPVELRQMLSIFREAQNSEFGARFFTEFMLQKGYDGLIYNEGGDHPDQKHTTSYVFYNPEKIGTYETWHSE